ncbi:MAG: hypothetical protein JXN64_11010 [Spirochaetes bacterium]|nr:hypothetical protein [Spirochaetota bacterium]
MKGEILLQNIVNLFIISIVLNAAVMAIFSISTLKKLSSLRSVEATRDLIVILLSLFICYKVDILRIFKGTGINIPFILDTILSALVLTTMINFIRQFMSRLKQNNED